MGYHKSLIWGISPSFPLANHFDLSGSIFGISQDPPMWAHASLNQDGFYRKGDITPALTSEESVCTRVVKKVS